MHGYSIHAISCHLHLTAMSLVESAADFLRFLGASALGRCHSSVLQCLLHSTACSRILDMGPAHHRSQHYDSESEDLQVQEVHRAHCKELLENWSAAGYHPWSCKALPSCFSSMHMQESSLGSDTVVAASVRLQGCFMLSRWLGSMISACSAIHLNAVVPRVSMEVCSHEVSHDSTMSVICFTCPVTKPTLHAGRLFCAILCSVYKRS